MSDPFRQKCKEYISNRTMRIGGTRWEYPIPDSKEYWQKICDEEKKKLLVVRDPSPNLSYHSFSNNDTNPNNRTSKLNSFPNSCISVSKASKNSLHKLSPLDCERSINKDYSNSTELFPKSILKASSRAPSKSFGTPCNLDTPSKVTRIPKLDTPSPQPSFGGVFAGKVDHIRASCGVQNEPKAQTESFSVSSSTLPILNAFPTILASKTPLKKSHKNLFKYPTTKYSKLLQKRSVPGTKSAAYPKQLVDTVHEDDKRDEKRLEDEDSLKYSIRYAYKALKHLTKDKTLDFNPNITNLSSEKLFPESSNDSFVSDEKKLRLLKNKKSKKHKRDSEGSLQEKWSRKSFKDSQFADIDVGRATSKLEETISKTIPSGSRSTSGPSPGFVHPEPWTNPSAPVLSSIPKLSGFPRKNCDRCLPCMYKSFEPSSKRNISFPMTVLRKALCPQSICSSPSSSSSEDSISVSIANLEDEMERIVNCEVETKSVIFNEDHEVSESQVVKGVPFLFEERRKEIVEETEQRTVLDSESSHKTITKKDEEDQRDGDLTPVAKNLNDSTNSVQVASLEQLKVSSSFQSEGSIDDDSLAVSISDNQSNPINVAPCHAPINLNPSLEPLRALRNRKPTTLQDRIALTESSSMKKSISTDDYDDVQEKPRSKDVSNKSKTGDEGRAISVGRTLIKAKSVAEKLTLENAHPETTEKEDRVLRKGTSLLNFSVTENTVSDKSKICREASRGALRESKSSKDDFSHVTPAASSSKLPITEMDEITEILKNLSVNTPSTTMLDTLCKEFSERLSKNVTGSNAKKDKIIARLTRLLVDSKRYLHPEKFPSDLLFSTNQPPPCNPRILRRILPLDTYNRLQLLLGLPVWAPKKETSFEDTDSRRSQADLIFSDETLSSEGSGTSIEVQPPTLEDTESLDGKREGDRRYNPYALFLMKPKRKVITWRPLTKSDLEGYDPDATLQMRAENMMKKICQDFCEWVATLGGTDNTIDEEVLRDMFEIDFNAEACKTMKVLIEEMPVVSAEVALTRNSPGASKLAMTRKHVMKDVKAEETPAKTQAFGTFIPWKLQFVPPNNQVRKNWLECEHVPEDLETMEVVWKGIAHLKSVTGFIEWLQQNPKVPPPEALKTIVSMDISTLRQLEDDDTFAHLELDMDQIQTLRIAVSDETVA